MHHTFISLTSEVATTVGVGGRGIGLSTLTSNLSGFCSSAKRKRKQSHAVIMILNPLQHTLMLHIACAQIVKVQFAYTLFFFWLKVTVDFIQYEAKLSFLSSFKSNWFQWWIRWFDPENNNIKFPCHQSYLRLVTFVGKAASRSSKPAKDSTTRGLHITYHSVLYCTDSLQHIPLIQHQGTLQYESLGHILVNQS